MPVSSKEPLDIQTTAECTFTLKRECDMIRTHNYKISCRSTLFYYFTAKLRFKASQTVHGGTTPVAPSKNRIETISIHLIRKAFPVVHIYLLVKKSQEKPCLPH